MRILHLLSQRPDSTGSGIYLQAMLRESARSGCVNHTIAAVNSGDFAHGVPPAQPDTSIIAFETPSLDFPVPGMSDVMPYRSTTFKDLTPSQLKQYESIFTEAITEAIDRFSPDILHSHHLWLLTSLARTISGNLPLVTSCHGSDLRQFQICRHFQDRVLRGCMNVDRVFALTEAQKFEISKLFSIGPDRVEVTGAGFNDAVFTYKEKDSSPPLQLIYCGKLSRSKGVPFLLKALQCLDDYDWQLHLVGSGSSPEKDECLALAQQLGERVTLHGAVSQTTLASLLQCAHLLVLPSLYEGLPLVILEALACGCRVIATDLPGCLEVHRHFGSDMVQLIQTPTLLHVDRISPGDDIIFTNSIREAICQSFNSFAGSPVPHTHEFHNAIHRFTWSGVFTKIYRVYNQLVQ